MIYVKLAVPFFLLRALVSTKCQEALPIQRPWTASRLRPSLSTTDVEGSLDHSPPCPCLLHRKAQPQYPGKTIQAEQENNSKAVHGAARSKQDVRRNVFWGF